MWRGHKAEREIVGQSSRSGSDGPASQLGIHNAYVYTTPQSDRVVRVVRVCHRAAVGGARCNQIALQGNEEEPGACQVRMDSLRLVSMLGIANYNARKAITVAANETRLRFL